MLNNFNMDLIDKNDSLLLAVSGGIDSMVMLHFFNEVKKNHKIKIAVAHFDHKKRKESFLDCQLVVDTCKKLSIDCYTDNLDFKKYDNFHDYARTKRYEFFVKIANQIGANKIVLAHNSNDNAETVLMRITRGSSFEGYRGILAKSKYDNVEVIRPLINVSRSEISYYQKQYKVNFNEDNSNQEDCYTRNRFRHHTLPLLEKENPKYLDKFRQFSDYLTNAYDYIEKNSLLWLDKNLKKFANSYEIEVIEFNKLDQIIKIDVIKKIVNYKTENTLELNYQNIQDIISIFSNKKPNLELPFNDKLHIYKSYNSMYFTDTKTESVDYEFEINEPTEIILPNGHLVIITKNTNKYNANMIKLCYNNLDFPFPITVRNRRNGDKIKTSSGTKKIKDIFINKKLSLDIRNQLPIFLDKNKEIIWVPNIHKKKTSGENTIYLIYQEGNKNA